MAKTQLSEFLSVLGLGLASVSLMELEHKNAVSLRRIANLRNIISKLRAENEALRKAQNTDTI